MWDTLERGRGQEEMKAAQTQAKGDKYKADSAHIQENVITKSVQESKTYY